MALAGHQVTQHCTNW